MRWKQPKNWENVMRAKGHTPRMADYPGEDGEPQLDYWAWSDDSSHHNGPECAKCGWNCCWHCTDISEIPECSYAQCA